MRVRSVTIPDASGGLITGSGYITYWSVRDTTDSSGSVFQLYDGNSTDSQLLVDVSTTAGESTSEYIHRGHLIYQSSLYYNLASGTIGGRDGARLRLGRGAPATHCGPRDLAGHRRHDAGLEVLDKNAKNVRRVRWRWL